MPKKSKSAKLAKRVLRAAGAGDLAELQQIVTAAAALEGDATGSSGSEAGVSPLLECADADECQPLVREARRHGTPHVAGFPCAGSAPLLLMFLCCRWLMLLCSDCSTEPQLPGTHM